MRNDGGPAFGGAYDQVFGEDNGKGPLHKIEARVAGMSLRDYFAAHAPAEYLAVMTEKVQEAGDQDTEVATIMSAAAFMYADAMLAERKKL